MSIFKKMAFTSHSGVDLDWKIDCDGLTNRDLDTLAYIVSCNFVFNDVIGVLTGGIRFANALKKYICKTALYPLIVDDVLTTGKSMEEEYEKINSPAIGIVIFSRTINCAAWIHPIFILNLK